MFGFYVSLDVKLIDGSPSADAAHPPLSRGSGGGVGINERIQRIQVAEKFLTCNWPELYFHQVPTTFSGQ